MRQESKAFWGAFPKADSLTSLPRFYEEKQKQWKNPLLSLDDIEEKGVMLYYINLKIGSP